MCSTDRLPLADGPWTVVERIRQRSPNRLGAVYSALYSFWNARHAAQATAAQQLNTRRSLDTVYSTLYNLLSAAGSVAGMADQSPESGRRDAYSVVLFSDSTKTVLTNDLTSDPDQLLDIVLGEEASGGTNFTAALRASQSVMLQNWSTERLVA
jgi:hypothetical protein